MNRSFPFDQEELQRERPLCYNIMDHQIKLHKKRHRFGATAEISAQINKDKPVQAKAVPVHASITQPILGKRPRQAEAANATTTTTSTTNAAKEILEDLVQSQQKYSNSQSGILLATRKSFWKRQLSSTMSKADFDGIWNEARDKFVLTLKKPKPKSPEIIDLLSSSEDETTSRDQTQGNNNSNTATAEGAVHVVENDNDNDRWAHLFFGHPNYRSENVFTLDKFDFERRV